MPGVPALAEGRPVSEAPPCDVTDEAGEGTPEIPYRENTKETDKIVFTFF